VSTHMLPPSGSSSPPLAFPPLPRSVHLVHVIHGASHKSILDYLHNSGLSASYDALRSETHHDDFNPDPKSKHAGLLEKKWTSVIRLQKKVSLISTSVLGYVSVALELLGGDGRARASGSSAGEGRTRERG
jgi:hypothetical protein